MKGRVGVVRGGIVALMVAAASMVLPGSGAAQEGQELLLAVGGGGTYYCIVSRCDDGGTASLLAGWAPRPALAFTVAGRWHGCFDCDRFLIGDASLEVRVPDRTVQPFAAVGLAVSSDPDFMGTKVGLQAAVGTWLWMAQPWGLRAELRGRQVGRGDAMGELGLALAFRTSAGG